jgi:hypothetical protein
MSQWPENKGISSGTNLRPDIIWPDVPFNLGDYFALNIFDKNISFIHSNLYPIVDNQ